MKKILLTLLLGLIVTIICFLLFPLVGGSYEDATYMVFVFFAIFIGSVFVTVCSNQRKKEVDKSSKPLNKKIFFNKAILPYCIVLPLLGFLANLIFFSLQRGLLSLLSLLVITIGYSVASLWLLKRKEIEGLVYIILYIVAVILLVLSYWLNNSALLSTAIGLIFITTGLVIGMNVRKRKKVSNN